MRFDRHSASRAGFAMLLSAIVACEEPHISSIGELSINGGRAVEMTPGTVRLNTTLTDTAGNNLAQDLVPAINTTGPFTAAWETETSSRRILVVHASQPGTGTLSLTLDGRTATINLTAVALTFKNIVVDDDYGCGIADDDRAWCWGSNFTHQLGFDTPAVCNGSACQYGGVGDQDTPLPVTTSSKFTQLAVGGSSCPNGSGFVFGTCGRSCGLTIAGRAECWGNLSSAVPAMPPETTFTALTTQPGSGYFASGTRSCGIAASGRAYCFAPAATEMVNGMTVQSLSMGRNHSCAVASDGDAYCWGSNAKGALGIGSVDAATHSAPERVATAVKFTTVNVSDASTCALSTVGSLYCWGAGYQLNGSNPPPACPSLTQPCQTTPRVIDDRTYRSFSLANDQTTVLCALDAAGATSCWTILNGPATTVTLPEPLATISSGGFYGRHFACGVGATSKYGYCWQNDFVATVIGR